MTTQTMGSPMQEVRTNGPRRARRAGRWIARAMLGLVALALVASGTNAALQVRDRQRFPPPGELVELSDGRHLHLDVSGVGNDGATVILDSGHGAFSPVFSHLQRELTDTLQVVSYDRPGYGWSDRADPDRPPFAVAEDLREALTTAGIDGPFLVVGHSLGGLYARQFAGRFSDEVVGLALIEPAHEEQLTRLPEDIAAQMRQLERLGGPLVAAGHLGIIRLMNPGADTTPGLPEESADQLQAASVTPSYLRSYVAEARGFDALSASVPALANDRPTIVINAPAAEPGWERARPVMNDMNRELADSSPQAELLELAGADHTSIVTDQQYAAEVAAEVQGLHSAITDGVRLRARS